MSTRWLAGTIVVATVGAWSSTARASCASFFPATHVPFNGLSLPANAELRIINAFNDFELTSPDGTTRSVGFADDDLGTVVDLDVRTLPPGSYGFVTNGFPGTFELLADAADDDEAPAAPVVTYETTSNYNGPSLPFAECPSSGGSSRSTRFDIEGASPGDVAVVNGRAFPADDVVIGDAANDYTIALRDVAGNESEATIVPVEGGCGGCTSASFSPFALALLTLLRRRRTSGPATM